MMSPTKFEMWNGHTAVTHCDDAGLWQAQTTCDCGRNPVLLNVGTGGHTESRALELLADIVLETHKQITLGRDGWACRECESIHSLHVHHKIFRSHERDDRIANLIVLCHTHHELAHKGKSAHRTRVV